MNRIQEQIDNIVMMNQIKELFEYQLQVLNEMSPQEAIKWLDDKISDGGRMIKDDNGGELSEYIEFFISRWEKVKIAKMWEAVQDKDE